MAAIIRTLTNRTITTVGTSMEAPDFEPSSIAHEVFGAGAAGKFGLEIIPIQGQGSRI